MDSRKAHKALRELGFSEYEVKAYFALLALSPSNGYRVASRSGIPRAKVYECLERLAERGAAVRVETSDESARVFAAVEPGVLIDGIRAQMSRACDRARKALARLKSEPRLVEVLWRITSREDLLARARTVVDGAETTLHVALWADEFEQVLSNLSMALTRGVKTALILYSPHPALKEVQKLGAGAIQHSDAKLQAVPEMGRQFMLAADRRQCISGSIFSDGQVDGVFSMNRGLITNTVDLVNHEIYVERILQDVGRPVYDFYGDDLGALDSFDSPQTRKE